MPPSYEHRMGIKRRPDSSVMFERRQFPVKPAFAMTINKAQGQTLQLVGVYLPDTVFTHGQLYVALTLFESREYLSEYPL